MQSISCFAAVSNIRLKEWTLQCQVQGHGYAAN